MRVRQVVPRDAIPSVDNPVFGADYGGDPTDEVIVVDAEPPRAYPVRFLHYHEIVNDELDGELVSDTAAIAVTWCPLCGSAAVYDRRVGDRTLSFGVSGKLADDDLVMYDRETESEWKQSTGECIAGGLEEQSLRAIPAGTTTWGQFRESNPRGVVLQPPGGRSEASGAGDDPEPIEYDADPYEAYFEADGFGLGAHRGRGGRDWDRENLDPKAVVVGIELDGEAIGVPARTIDDRGGSLTLTVGGRDLVVFSTEDGLHAFENPGYDFDRDDGGRFHADGTAWNATTGRASDGRRLQRLPIRRLFAFAWQDDHGPDAFYEPSAGAP